MRGHTGPPPPALDRVWPPCLALLVELGTGESRGSAWPGLGHGGRETWLRGPGGQEEGPPWQGQPLCKRASPKQAGQRAGKDLLTEGRGTSQFEFPSRLRRGRRV